MCPIEPIFFPPWATSLEHFSQPRCQYRRIPHCENKWRIEFPLRIFDKDKKRTLKAEAKLQEEDKFYWAALGDQGKGRLQYLIHCELARKEKREITGRRLCFCLWDLLSEQLARVYEDSDKKKREASQIMVKILKIWELERPNQRIRLEEQTFNRALPSKKHRGGWRRMLNPTVEHFICKIPHEKQS